MASKTAPQIGGNLMIASALAVLSYVPFEVVAKGSVVFSVLLFVFDPIPPVSRILALITAGMVGVIAKAHREWQEAVAQEEAAEAEEEAQREGRASPLPPSESHDDFVVVDKSDGDDDDDNSEEREFNKKNE